jgi:hypothetical protein
MAKTSEDEEDEKGKVGSVTCLYSEERRIQTFFTDTLTKLWFWLLTLQWRVMLSYSKEKLGASTFSRYSCGIVVPVCTLWIKVHPRLLLHIYIVRYRPRMILENTYTRNLYVSNIMIFILQDDILFAYLFYPIFRTMMWNYYVHSEIYKDGALCGKNCVTPRSKTIPIALYTSKQCHVSYSKH